MIWNRKVERLKSVFSLKCPRCEKGDLFLNSNPYTFRDVGKMPSTCPNCGQAYSLEPGFYFGAAYVSYALTVALFIAVFIATYVLFDPEDVQVYFISIIVAILLAAPYLFLLSRSIWISFFVKKKS